MKYKNKNIIALVAIIFIISSLNPRLSSGQEWLGTWKVIKVLKNGNEKTPTKVEIYLNITKNNINRFFYKKKSKKCTKFLDEIIEKKRKRLVVNAKDSGKTKMELEMDTKNLTIHVLGRNMKLVTEKVERIPNYIIECSKE